MCLFQSFEGNLAASRLLIMQVAMGTLDYFDCPLGSLRSVSIVLKMRRVPEKESNERRAWQLNASDKQWKVNAAAPVRHPRTHLSSRPIKGSTRHSKVYAPMADWLCRENFEFEAKKGSGFPAGRFPFLSGSRFDISAFYGAHHIFIRFSVFLSRSLCRLRINSDGSTMPVHAPRFMAVFSRP